MNSNDEVLKVISNETKSSIDQLPVVTPSVYASIFAEFVKKHDIEIDNENDLSRDIMAVACSNLTDLQTQASKNAKRLSENATKAIDAIKEKDESALSEVIKETQNLRKEVEKLKEAVYKDELTHVFNRKWLHDNFLEAKTDKFIDSGKLAIIDLNYFKIVNDTYGHIIGDKVLVFISNQLKKTKYDVVRYGGDEFIIILRNSVSLKEAEQKINALREDIIRKKLKANDSSFRVSFSFGVTEFFKGDEFGFVIEKADKNMYKDKTDIKKRIKGI